MLANQELVARHVEDIAFLWNRRCAVVRASRLSHDERVELDTRVDANVEGAALAGEIARQAAMEALEARPEPGSIFAAAALALKDSNADMLERLLAKMPWDEGAVGAFVSAVGWSRFADVEPLLSRWAEAEDDRLALVALAGFTSHRRSSGLPPTRALRSASPLLRAAAAKAIGELGECEHVEALVTLLRDESPTVRFQAVRSLARFGDDRHAVREALSVLTAFPGPFAEAAVAALVRLAPGDAPALFGRLTVVESSRRLALVAAETLGSMDFVEALFPWMEDDGIARTVGDVLRTITGADLIQQRLSRPRPAHAPGDPTDDPDDPNVELPRDYELPFPSVTEIAAWWGRSNGRYASGVRYLNGLPIGLMGASLSAEHLENLRTLARTGRPRHQTMASAALAQTDPTAASVETHAFASTGHAVPNWETARPERGRTQHGRRTRTKQEEIIPSAGTLRVLPRAT